MSQVLSWSGLAGRAPKVGRSFTRLLRNVKEGRHFRQRRNVSKGRGVTEHGTSWNDSVPGA